jgi:uncharacterized membrane protein
MAIADAPDAPTRREAAAGWLAQNPPEGLARATHLARYDFGRELVEVSEFRPAAEERLTATGDAIAAAARRMKGRAGGAIIVVGDGRTTAGRERGVTVHAVGVGDAVTARFRDRKISNLLCPGLAQTESTVPIHAFVVALGEKGATIAVRLKVDNELVEQKELVADSERWSARVTFHYAAAQAGEKRVLVEAAVDEGEFDPKNNSMSTFLRVAQKELRVLYVEGKLRWEFTFLKRALAQLPGAHFQTKSLFAAVEPPDPAELEKYNVVVLGDVTAAQVGGAWLGALEKHVSEREAGVLFVAGSENLAEGAGWRGTPMASLLPFELEGTAPPAEKPTAVRLTTFGSQHFAAALDRDAGANLRAWGELPKLEAVARPGAPKPAASVLAETDAGAPLLIAQPFGKGRTIAFLAETAWKWALESDGSAEKYRRFWHQCVLWLARKEKTGRKLWVELDRYLYVAGDPVEVTAYVEDPPGTPVPDASLRLTVEGPGGGAPAVPASFYGGAYHATLLPADPGDYRVTVEARRDRDDFGRATARFNVIAPSAELDQPSADFETLAAIAAAGGGLFKPLADAKEVFDRAARDAVPLRIERVHRRSLWDRAWLALLFVAALSVEWIVRKWNRLP